MKRITVATLLVTLLVGLLSAQALASPPVQSTHTVTLASSQEVAVGYNRDLDEKVGMVHIGPVTGYEHLDNLR